MTSRTLANSFQGNRFWVLDMIRGLTILAVVCFHVFADARNAQPDSSTVWISWLKYGGGLGISIFFVLSGFSFCLPVLYLGRISYSVYLLHQIFVPYVNSVLKSIPLNDASHFVLVLVGVLTVTLPSSLLVHQFLELPFSQQSTKLPS